MSLVSPQPRALYSGMIPGWLAGHYDAAQCAIPITPLAEAAGVRFTAATATRIDPAHRRVEFDDGRSFGYDLLSIDTGPAADRDSIAGADRHALFVRPLGEFVERLASWVADTARSPRGLAVIGGGSAGVELAMALAWRLGAGARLTLVAGPDGALPSHPPRARRLASAALRRLGIAVSAQACSTVTAERIGLGDGTWLDCDLALIATGPVASRWLASSGLSLDRAGFVATAPTLQTLSHPEVFAAGDVAVRPDSPHPRSGVYAVRAGAPLALNLRCAVAGLPLRNWKPQARALSLLACGGQRAIASWGPFALEGDWVWRWKDRIDRGFVGGFNLETAVGRA